jgi:hypothetical protein
VTIATITLNGRDFPQLSWLAAGSRGVTSPTVARAVAILLWLLGPVLAIAVLAVPPFLLLAIAFGGGFLVFAVRGLSSGKPVGALFVAPSRGFAPGLFGIVGAGLFWLLALRLLAAPDGAAVAGPWPVLGAAVIGLIGQPSPGPIGGPALGYVLALCGALCWIVTGATRRHRPGGAPDLVGGLYGIAAPLCFVLHLCLEPRLPLDAASLLAAAAVGLGPLGIAHLLWDRGTCRGDVPAFSAARRRGAGGR